ncbi:MAG: MCE family protein [Acidobacteriia bacterium]|nr:MCE family protein [Terriglobia bacterium]
MPSARQITWSKVRSLVVAVAALSILTVLVYLLTGGTLLEPKSTLYLYIDDATGLSSGSAVRVNGIGVGKVDSVALSGSNQPTRVVRVNVTVEQRYLSSIPADSFAQISSDTAIGDKYVDVTRGRSTTHLETNGEIIFRPQPDLTKTLDIEQFTTSLRGVDEMVTAIEAGQGPVGQLVTSEALYNQVLNGISGVNKDLRRFTDPKGAIGNLLFTDQLYNQIGEPLRRLNESLTALESGQGTLGVLLRDSAQYDKLRTQLAGLRSSLENLAANSFLKNADAYRDWNRMLTGFIQRVDEFSVNPLLATSETYDSLNGSLKQLGSQLRDFREDPQKFLRIKLF